MSAISTDRFWQRRSTIRAWQDPYNNIKRSFNINDGVHGHYLFISDLDERIWETPQGRNKIHNRLRLVADMLSRTQTTFDEELRNISRVNFSRPFSTYALALETLIELKLVSQVDKKNDDRSKAQAILREYLSQIQILRQQFLSDPAVSLDAKKLIELRKFFAHMYKIAMHVSNALHQEERQGTGCF